MSLTAKERLFADAYIETSNATEAARRAGYSARASTSKVTACRILQRPDVKAYIAGRMEQLESERTATLQEVVEFLTAVMRGEVKDQFGLEASIQDRTNAAKELLKRFNVADSRTSATMARLDAILLEFTTAINAPEGEKG